MQQCEIEYFTYVENLQPYTRVHRREDLKLTFHQPICDKVILRVFKYTKLLLQFTKSFWLLRKHQIGPFDPDRAALLLI